MVGILPSLASNLAIAAAGVSSEKIEQLDTDVIIKKRFIHLLTDETKHLFTRKYRPTFLRRDTYLNINYC